jgi:Holliday junction DNA helicase RuvA
MIGRLRGTLVTAKAGGVVLDVAGVGYEIAVTPRTLVELPVVGEEVVLHTHLVVREDAMALYGFTADRERDLFRLLLTASGVGPKVALALLGAVSPTELQRAIITEDVDALTVVPGIGKRSAQKLILDLRPKLGDGEGIVVGGVSAAGRVREALEALGFGAGEIAEVMPELDGDAPVEDQVRTALRRLGSSPSNLRDWRPDSATRPNDGGVR